MPRQIESNTLAQLTASPIYPVWLLQITLGSGTYYLWTGVGTISWGNKTWTGLGDLGSISVITEGTGVEAQGTSVSLSGVNNTILMQALGDVQVGAAVYIYLGFLSSNMSLILDPVCQWAGMVDQPSISYGPATSTITIALENKLNRLRTGGSQRKYTAADQRAVGRYPDDIAFSWVESLNDIALLWGQK